MFLTFLLFAVQLLFGLYASSTVNAVANDAATRASTSSGGTNRQRSGVRAMMSATVAHAIKRPN